MLGLERAELGLLPCWGPLGLLLTPQALGISDINKPPHWLRIYGWVTPNVDRNFQKLSEPSGIFQLQICLESALSIGVETHKSVQKIRQASSQTSVSVFNCGMSISGLRALPCPHFASNPCRLARGRNQGWCCVTLDRSSWPRSL